MNRPFQKLLIALLIAVILIFGVSGPLLRNSGERRLAESQTIRDNAKIDHIAMALSDQDRRYEAFSDHFVENLHRSVDMMCVLLKDFVTEEGYSGPTDFEEGAIVRYEDHKIELLGDPEVRPDLKEEYFSAEVPYITSYIEADGITDHVMLVIKKIDGPYYYVDWTSFDELRIYHVNNDIFQGSLSDLEKIYGAHVFVISDEDYFIYVSSALENYNEISTEEFDTAKISSKNVLNFRGTDYFCTYRHFEEQRYTIFLLSEYSELSSASLRWALFFELLAFIFIAAVLVWVCFIEKKARDEILTEEKKAQYEPSKIRFNLILFALIGVLLIFMTTYFIQLMNSLYTQTRQGDQILDVLIQASQEEEEQISASQIEEVEWYTYYARQLSDLTQKYPELAQKETLAKVSNIIGSDYLILFDETGNEISSSADYIGYSISSDPDSQTYDFRKLLMGVPYVVKDVEQDELSQKNLKMIGARTDLQNGRYGAVLMAVDPDEFTDALSDEMIDSRLQAMSYGEDLLFIADGQSGIIKRSSDPSLIENNISSIGIDTSRISDSTMDRFSIGHDHYYGLSKAYLNDIFFYFVADSSIRGTSLYYCSDASFSFLAAFIVSVWIMIYGYTKEEYDLHAAKGVSMNRRSVNEDAGAYERQRAYIHNYWYDLSPEEKTQLVFEFLLSVLIIGLLYFVRKDSGLIADTLMNYILSGQYDRGINLFAITSTILLIIGAVLVMIVLKFITSLLCLFLNTKGITICKLLFNLAEYVAVITVLYYSFGYLGFDNRGLLASVGFITLAISLGSRDLVSDILSGLTIVFEGEFKVGDMVEIGGFTGRVTDIGIRYTKLLGMGDNIKIIANRDIRSVVNMTKLNSWYATTLTIPSDELSKAEAMLEKELPKIGSSIDEIISTPRYKGIEKIGNGTLSLIVLAECNQENYRRVSRLLNRELYKACKEYGITLK